MAPREGIARLEQYGYTPDEAGFLYLAALHSGYFLRRQFNEFLGQERGANAQRFVEKLVARRHAQRERYQVNQFVYHIRGKGIYSRLGQVDNRNRREKTPFIVKRKLMCLDFVLAHLDHRFLATEAEKVEYFVVERGIEVESLPSRRYQSRSTTETTERFFIEKFPMYLDASSSSLTAPVVHFAYVDEGVQSLEGFSTFARQHRRLFEALRHFEVVYVGTESRWFARAETIFRNQFPGTSTVTLLSPEARELIDYFEARRKFETRDFRGLDTNRIVQYRQEKLKFAGDANDQLYRRWLDGGTNALYPQSDGTHDARFRPHLLTHEYGMFGGIQRAS